MDVPFTYRSVLENGHSTSATTTFFFLPSVSLSYPSSSSSCAAASKMEKSSSFVNSSSMNNNYDSSIGSEESGWTSYFEEAFSDINGGQQSSFSYSSSSLISDAASSAAWRFSNTNNFDYTSPSTGNDLNLPKKLSFKRKSRNRKIFYDDSLEDTAISPANSPKVSDVRGFDVTQRKTLFDKISSSAAKARSSEKYSETQEDDTAGLEKRGLCLVPLSMLVNYLG